MCDVIKYTLHVTKTFESMDNFFSVTIESSDLCGVRAVAGASSMKKNYNMNLCRRRPFPYLRYDVPLSSKIGCRAKHSGLEP